VLCPVLPALFPLSRKEGDFEKNDEVYDALDDASKEAQAAHVAAAGAST
jgi:hypothetical protein